jgi:hypothetical protein
MHTTPQKRLFQTPSEILVHRGVCILNGMAPSSPQPPTLSTQPPTQRNSESPDQWLYLFLAESVCLFCAKAVLTLQAKV